MTSEARYRNLPRERSGVDFISAFDAAVESPFENSLKPSNFSILFRDAVEFWFCFVFFFPSQSAFSSTLIRFYFESIYSCLNSPVYLIPVKQLADQLRVHYRQPACSKIIQVSLATEQRDAWTHTGHLVQGRVPSPLHPLLSAELLAALATFGPCFSVSGVVLWHSPHFVAGSSPAL